MKKCFALVLFTIVVVVGCATGNETLNSAGRIVGSTAVGAGSGALIGQAFHNPAAGALVGTGVGLAGGYLYDQYRRGQQQAPSGYYPSTPAPTGPVPGATYFDASGNPYHFDASGAQVPGSAF